MITLDIEQGSPEWLAARLGIPTASMFSNVITPAGAKSTGTGYIRQLAGEWLIGQPDPDAFTGSKWMERGKDLEPEARAMYAMLKEVEVKQVGLVYRDALRDVACSPDGLVGDNGGWECKCPKLTTMVSYLIADMLPSEYKPQVQGNMWVCEREWWDFMAYHPLTEPLLIRVMRDDEYIEKMHKYMQEFLFDLKTMKDKLRKYKL